MLAINELNDVYCDALSCDGEYLVFGSFWGRDTAIQELLARITLSQSEGGLSQLSFDGHTSATSMIRFENYPAKIGNPDRLDKMTGRMPKSNLFGDLVHLWLFDKTVIVPDYVNHQAYLLIQPGQDDQVAKTWALIKEVCQLPLLEHWRDIIFSIMREQRWLKRFDGHEMNLISITIPEAEFNDLISEKIKCGELTVTDFN